MQRPGVVTTSRRAAESEFHRAGSLAQELGWPYASRGGRSIDQLRQLWACPSVVVVRPDRSELDTGDERFFYHPGMAIRRIENLASGRSDPMVRAIQLKPGDRVLDCTLGLAADALVAAYVVGPGGRVVGLESSAIVAALVRDGLSRYVQDADVPGIQDAVRRIEVVNADYREYLRALPAQSFDVVYFDPMFGKPVSASTGIHPLRRLANPDPVEQDAIELARYVAGRRVVLKERMGSAAFSVLGLRKVEEGASGRVAYGVLDTRAFLPTGPPSGARAPHPE